MLYWVGVNSLTETSPNFIFSLDFYARLAYANQKKYTINNG